MNSNPKQPPAKTEFPPPVWQYGEFGIRDSYYADVALEGMYRRFLESDDWSELVNDLWNFHSSYRKRNLPQIPKLHL